MISRRPPRAPCTAGRSAARRRPPCPCSLQGMRALPPALTSRFGGVPVAAATLQRLLAGGVRTHPLPQRSASSLNAQCHNGEERDDLTSMWRDVELRHASMSTDTGILSCWLCLQDELILHKHSRSLSLSLQSSPLPSCPRSRRHPLSSSSRASHIGATSEACDKWACATAPRVRG